MTPWLNPWVLTFITGCLVLVSSCFVGLHQILGSPDRPNYPTAPARLRVAMFLWCATLFYRAAEIIGGLYQPHPVLVTFGAFQASIMLTIVHGLLLEQQLRLWLPARLHARIRRLVAIASCRAGRGSVAARTASNRALWAGVPLSPTSARGVGPALATLQLDGFTVFAPDEPPGSVLDGRENER